MIDAPGPEGSRSAAGLIDLGTRLELTGRLDDAMASYADAVDLAADREERCLHAEALRRLGILHHRRGESDTAELFCRQSHNEAAALGEPRLSALALMALGNFALEMGRHGQARSMYQAAALLADREQDRPLLARLEQNLGNLAASRSDPAAARRHFIRALAAYTDAQDDHGPAMIHHNLARLAGDLAQWDEVIRRCEVASALATAAGDRHLLGLCLLTRAEACLAEERYETARQDLEEALAIFDQLDTRLDKPDALRLLGRTLHAMGRPALAESRLRSAIEIARSTGGRQAEAQATRDYALFCRDRKRENDFRLHAAHAREMFVALELPGEAAALQRMEAER